MIVTRYTIPASVHHLKIAQVSDLHEAEPEETIALLRQEKPDLIVITGDLIERTDDDKRQAAMEQWYTRRKEPVWHPTGLTAVYAAVNHAIVYAMCKLCDIGQKEHHENAYRLLEEASKIAPVYYSLGNHEYYLELEDAEVCRRFGVTILDNSYTYTHGIWIGGLSSLHTEDWLPDFQQETGYKLLLMHQPELYDLLREQLTGIDLILAGHAHGGQWRIAGHGIWSPGQGFLPKYHHGLYDDRLIVSAGMTNTLPVPRFGNPQELVIINLENLT